MSENTNRTPATAADFVEYVAELRAEGISDAEIVERWMRQARPEGGVCRYSINAWAMLDLPRWRVEYSEPDCFSDCHLASIRPVPIEVEALTREFFDSLESALAWLANQLAERCPVACDAPHPTNVMVIQSILDGDPDEAPARIHRIRRMFAIAEPGEVGA